MTFNHARCHAAISAAEISKFSVVSRWRRSTWVGARVFEYQQESQKGEKEGLNVGITSRRERGRSKKNEIEDGKLEMGKGTRNKARTTEARERIDPLGRWAAAPACTWMIVESTYSFVTTPLYEAALSITRSRNLPGCEMVSGLSFAYPLIALSVRLRTLAVRFPLKPTAAPAPDSSRREALTTRCCTFWAGVPIGFTAMTTGIVKGEPGWAAVGGVVSKDSVNSRLAIFGFVWRYGAFEQTSFVGSLDRKGYLEDLLQCNRGGMGVERSWNCNREV